MVALLELVLVLAGLMVAVVVLFLSLGIGEEAPSLLFNAFTAGNPFLG